MKFTLIYDGPLKSNGSVPHKHELRQHFEKQLENVWKRSPLDSFWNQIQDEAHKEHNYRRGHFIHNKGGVDFVALINVGAGLMCKLDVTLLRPGSPGRILTQVGDIDNQLKTLFDALSVPQKNQIPPSILSTPPSNPIHCLLQDDSLISNVAVDTEELLTNPCDQAFVRLNIDVSIRVIKPTIDYNDLGI